MKKTVFLFFILSALFLGKTAFSKWTTTLIRPPTSYTAPLKLKSMIQYGDIIPDPNATCMVHSNNSKCYEFDHLISLELGGSPVSPQNLWPEPYLTKINGKIMGARQKDKVENYLHDIVCKGKLTLEESQSRIVNDWYAVYLVIP